MEKRIKAPKLTENRQSMDELGAKACRSEEAIRLHWPRTCQSGGLDLGNDSGVEGTHLTVGVANLAVLAPPQAFNL